MTVSATSVSRINVQQHGPLARITLSHPPLNVIDFPMIDELLEALPKLAENKEILAVVVSGG